MLYSLAILREHASSLAVLLATQLAGLDQQGGVRLADQLGFRKQAKQVGSEGAHARGPRVLPQASAMCGLPVRPHCVRAPAPCALPLRAACCSLHSRPAGLLRPMWHAHTHAHAHGHAGGGCAAGGARGWARLALAGHTPSRGGRTDDAGVAAARARAGQPHGARLPAGAVAAHAEDGAAGAWVGREVGGARMPGTHATCHGLGGARWALTPALACATPRAPSQAVPHAVTDDGVACPDLTVDLPASPGMRFALELVRGRSH